MGRDFSRHQVIVFDWDGTVADSVALVVRSVCRAAESMGFAPPDPAVVRPLIGLSLAEMLPRCLPGLPAARIPEFTETYRRHYFGNRNQVDIPFEGIPVLLARLAEQERRLAVATGKSRAGLDRVLQSTGLGRFFETTRCAEEGVSKPDPWMLHSLAEEMRVAPADMVMVGDSTYDIDMAKAFGCASIGVYYDTGTPEAFQRSTQPGALAGSVEDLGKLLTGADVAA